MNERRFIKELSAVRPLVQACIEQLILLHESLNKLFEEGDSKICTQCGASAMMDQTAMGDDKKHLVCGDCGADFFLEDDAA